MGKRAKTPHQLLTKSLAIAKGVSVEGIIKSNRISENHRARLLKSGWLKEIIKGWYVLLAPEENMSASVMWYTHYWSFIRIYLEDRFGKKYCLSAESSLEFHIESTVIPKQIMIIGPQASHQVLKLLEETSVVTYTEELPPDPLDVVERDGLRMMSQALSLAKLQPSFFRSRPRDIELALTSLQDISGLARTLVKLNNRSAAERILGALQAVHSKSVAQQFSDDLKMAGMNLNAVNPFSSNYQPLNIQAHKSIYKTRIDVLWKLMRDVIERHEPPRKWNDLSKAVVKNLIQDIHTMDAYHSLSIEGYQVTLRLIEKIANELWQPDASPEDSQKRDSMAAKGYHNAYLNVVETIGRMTHCENSIEILQEASRQWYRELFFPSVQAGLLRPHETIGYRNGPVYLRGSRHVPPRHEALSDCLDAFFENLKQEKNAFVRAILGHFIFVYIHPYVDGNGRIGRFILNALLVSQGYCWTVIRTENRNEYMLALEQASVDGDIEPFTLFVIKEMNMTWNVND